MNHKRTTMSIVLATVMLVSLFAVVISAVSVSGQASGTTVAANLVGQTMAGTGPAAAYGAAGIPVLVAVGTSGQVWCMLPSNSGGGWTSIGGSATSSPAATTPSLSPTAVIDVFVRGTNGALYERSTQNDGASWGTWSNLGGQLASGTGPAACSWSATRLDVFVEGTNGALYHKWSTNSGASWSNWQNLGGKLTASPAASAGEPPTAPNQIGVFVRGTDGACWYKKWTGTAWSSWKSLGGQLAPNTGPGVLGEGYNNTTDVPIYWVSVQGTDHQLWSRDCGEAGSYLFFDNVWSQLPACPEVLSASSPAACWSFSGHTEAFVSTTSGNLMCCFWNGDWTPVNTWEWSSQTSPP
ncbi:MAG: hypothetical protein WCG09_02390 [Halobacteriota archaeon]